MSVDPIVDCHSSRLAPEGSYRRTEIEAFVVLDGDSEYVEERIKAVEVESQVLWDSLGDESRVATSMLVRDLLLTAARDMDSWLPVSLRKIDGSKMAVSILIDADEITDDVLKMRLMAERRRLMAKNELVDMHRELTVE